MCLSALLLDHFTHKTPKHRNTIGLSNFKCSTFAFCLRYRNFMISIFDIICRKHFILDKFVDHGVDTKQLVCIEFSMQISCVRIVYAQSLLGILCTVLHNNYLSTPGAGLNDSSRQKTIYLILYEVIIIKT